MAETQKVRFAHPLYRTSCELEIPVSSTFREIERILIDRGFIDEKKGGYQFLFDDRICKLGATLETYIPEGVDCMDIRIHGLLVVLT